jgi:hypothetical protein
MTSSEDLKRRRGRCDTPFAGEQTLEESPLLWLKEAKAVPERLMMKRKFLVSENTAAIFE